MVIVKVVHADDLGAPELTLALDVALGATVYFGSNLVLWFLAGRPDGAEAIAVRFVAEKLGRGPKSEGWS